MFSTTCVGKSIDRESSWRTNVRPCLNAPFIRACIQLFEKKPDRSHEDNHSEANQRSSHQVGYQVVESIFRIQKIDQKLAKSP